MAAAVDYSAYSRQVRFQRDEGEGEKVETCSMTVLIEGEPSQVNHRTVSQLINGFFRNFAVREQPFTLAGLMNGMERCRQSLQAGLCGGPSIETQIFYEFFDGKE